MIERLAELWELPDYVSEAYAAAFASEVFHHVFVTFGYDMSALDGEEQDEIFSDVHDMVNASNVPTGRASCRAFAEFANGRESELGVSSALLAEWINI